MLVETALHPAVAAVGKLQNSKVLAHLMTISGILLMELRKQAKTLKDSVQQHLNLWVFSVPLHRFLWLKRCQWKCPAKNIWSIHLFQGNFVQSYLDAYIQLVS